MGHDYPEDADFLPDVDEADTAFSADFDPSEAGQPYMEITLPTWPREPQAEPAPEPVWDTPLLTPEAFMAKYGLKG